MALFRVNGMTCGHCVKAVENAVHEAAPQATVAVDLAAGTVRTDGIDPDAARAAIAEAGYEVTETLEAA